MKTTMKTSTTIKTTTTVTYRETTNNNKNVLKFWWLPIAAGKLETHTIKTNLIKLKLLVINIAKSPLMKVSCFAGIIILL